jgi:hypothetical protein
MTADGGELVTVMLPSEQPATASITANNQKHRSPGQTLFRIVTTSEHED